MDLRNPLKILRPPWPATLLMPVAVLLGLGLGLAGLWPLAVLAAFASIAVAARMVADRSAAPAGDSSAIASEAKPRGGAANDLQAMVDALPDPLVTIDARRRLIAANRAARELIGAVDAGGDLATAIRDPAVLAACDQVLADGTARAVELQWHGIVERDLRAVVLALPGASPAAAMVLLHDLTAMKRAEHMRADFVANASHELKTPIAALTGFIETLRGPARDDAEARARFLAIMDEQAKRMARLVEDLLSLSRIELDEHTRPDAPVDLLPLLRAVIDTLELRARQRGIALKLDSAGRVPPALGDRDQLQQVFQNLADNAVKYARANSVVTIELRLTEGGPALADGAPALAVAVRDQGEGIAAQHLPRLTERFYRIDNARSRQLGGTGLGLAIVKHIVNRHRGALSIDSSPGQGSVFTVFLPVAPAAAMAKANPAAAGRQRA